MLSWGCFIALFARERDAYNPAHTWMWRFPIFLILAAQLAKLR